MLFLNQETFLKLCNYISTILRIRLCNYSSHHRIVWHTSTHIKQNNLENLHLMFSYLISFK